jgi:hypothetical protein
MRLEKVSAAKIFFGAADNFLTVLPGLIWFSGFFKKPEVAVCLQP